MASKDESISCIRNSSSLRIHFPAGFLLNLGVIRTGVSAYAAEGMVFTHFFRSLPGFSTYWHLGTDVLPDKGIFNDLNFLIYTPANCSLCNFLSYSRMYQQIDDMATHLNTRVVTISNRFLRVWQVLRGTRLWLKTVPRWKAVGGASW